MPEVVQAATQAYRDEQDMLGQFIEECCVTLPECRVTSALLATEYDR